MIGKKPNLASMDFLTAASSNLTLIIPFSAMIAVQIFKFLRDWWAKRTPSAHVLFSTGGMPSSHSALVTSLATATGIHYGFGSGYFAISCVLAMIVMYDARGVRQESGQHARVLNQIVRELMSGQTISDRELKELLGHTTVEVFVGALFGIIYTLLLLQD
jgi:acid phosphatase family membrane protein YuiD